VNQQVEHVVAFLGSLCVICSAVLRIIPTPDEVKDEVGKVSGWYLVFYNILRRASLNSPYQPTRNENANPPK
jgi:hypothetical protein